jgi:hypothetical protein
MNSRIHSLLALLLMGSASLMAQSTDDFGEVISSKYQNNMTITGYVCMSTRADGEWTAINDEMLGKETVVAVYCGDELRGKSNPADYNDKYFNLLIMTVFGNNKDKLHFKVLTEGRVIEVDQGITFKTDDRIGKAKEPYYIYLPAPVVTTPTSEGWATTCLPFNAKVPEGVTLWNVTGIAEGQLVKSEIGTATSDNPIILPKDTPVLLKTEGTESYEWLSRVADGNVGTEGNILKGTTEPATVEANSVLTLGHSSEKNEVGFWLFDGTKIPANSAYITDFPDGSNGASLQSDNTTTGLGTDACIGIGARNSKCYDLSGRERSMVNGLRKGVYIVNGQKIVK